VVAEVDLRRVAQSIALGAGGREHGDMTTYVLTHDKIATRQRHDRLARRWSVSPDSGSVQVVAASGRGGRKPTSWLEQRLERVNRIAVLVAPGAVAMAASLFG
jgi:hypothetical protein